MMPAHQRRLPRCSCKLQVAKRNVEFQRHVTRATDDKRALDYTVLVVCWSRHSPISRSVSR